GRVDHVEALLPGPDLDRGRHAVGGEDDGSGIDLLQQAEAVLAVQRDHAQLIHFLHHVAVVDDLSEHVNGPGHIRIPGHPPDHLYGADDPVAIPPRGNLDHFHEMPSHPAGECYASPPWHDCHGGLLVCVP